MKAELENPELLELWSMYTKIRAKLTARIEAELRVVDHRLSVLSQEGSGQGMDAPLHSLAAVSDAVAPAIFNDEADPALAAISERA